MIFKCSFTLHRFAFADDLAMAADNLWALLKLLAVVLPRSEVAINLRVKAKKTIATPLWRGPHMHNTRRCTADIFPPWVVIQGALKAVYLGGLIGPEVSDEDRWSQIVSKFMSRARPLGGLGLG